MALSVDASMIYQLYITEKGAKPNHATSLTIFAKSKGVSLKFMDAKKMIDNQLLSPESYDSHCFMFDNPQKQSHDPLLIDNITSIANNKSKQKNKKIFINRTAAQLIANQQNTEQKANKPKPTPKKSKFVPNDEAVHFGKYIELIKIFNGYVTDKGEAPSNTFDLFNYIQFHNINGIQFKDVGEFLMKYKPSHINKVITDIINLEQNGNGNKNVPPPVTADMLINYGVNTKNN